MVKKVGTSQPKPTLPREQLAVAEHAGSVKVPKSLGQADRGLGGRVTKKPAFPTTHKVEMAAHPIKGRRS